MSGKLVNLMFKVPLGKSFPNGPYKAGKVYIGVGPDVYEDPIIAGLIKDGKAIVMTDIDFKTGDLLGFVDQMKVLLDDINKIKTEANKTLSEIKLVVDEAKSNNQLNKRTVSDVESLVKSISDGASKTKSTVKKAEDLAKSAG